MSNWVNRHSNYFWLVGSLVGLTNGIWALVQTGDGVLPIVGSSIFLVASAAGVTGKGGQA